LRQRSLKVEIIRIAALRNSPRQNADLQWVAAERIRLQRGSVVFLRLEIPIHFLALVIGRHGVDRGRLEWTEAKIKRKAV